MTTAAAAGQWRPYTSTGSSLYDLTAATAESSIRIELTRPRRGALPILRKVHTLTMEVVKVSAPPAATEYRGDPNSCRSAASCTCIRDQSTDLGGVVKLHASPFTV